MRKLATIVASGIVFAGLVAMPVPAAQAADVKYNYLAWTGGTYVKVFDGTVNSDFTAQSAVSGGVFSDFSKNSTAGVRVDGLARIGAVETRTRATVGDTSTTLRSFARSANVNLLGGLITADAVETIVTTTGFDNGTTTSRGGSNFLGIHIAGHDLPVDIPKNYQVTIPGVATVTLNYHAHATSGDLRGTVAYAISVTLLEPRAGYAPGVTLLVNPLHQYLNTVVPGDGASLHGHAYGTYIRAGAGDRIEVISDPTAYIATPTAGSGGDTLQNQVLGVNVPGVLTTGAVTSKSYSIKDNVGNAEIRNSNELLGVNLLGGLIRADAIRVSAYGRMQDGEWTRRLRMTTLNLVVAGQRIPVDVGRNTIIDVAGLGEVAINRRFSSARTHHNRIQAIRITLDTERAGLPVGAVIQIGVADTQIVPG